MSLQNPTLPPAHPAGSVDQSVPRRVVLIGGSAPFAALLEAVVRNGSAGRTRFTHALTAESVAETDIAGSCVLVHLGRRSSGLGVLEQVLPLAARAPIVAITESDDDERGLLALQRGAHEHISAHGCTTEQLLRAVRAARERQLSAMEREARDAFTADAAMLVREILDSLEMQAVALDAGGVILAVNQPWRAEPALAPRGHRFDVGDNYLERCQELAAHGSADLNAVVTGVRAVLARSTARWERDCVVAAGGSVRVVRVVALPLLARAGVVVTHTHIADGIMSRRTEDAAPDVGMRPHEVAPLRDEIERAVSANELSLAFQPIVAVDSGRIVGAEALLRWHRLGGHWVDPAEVIAAAERSGLIGDIGRWVLRTACARLGELNLRLGPRRRLGISINLSGAQLADPRMPGDVAAALRSARCDPGAVCLEVTETAIADDMIGAVANLDALRRLGVSIALDDFGTGYASLQYAKHFRVNIVKIDRIFVQEITRGGPDRVIVASVVALAHGLGALVIAEGVETEEQRRLLTALDCDGLQGFLLSRPVDFERFVQLCEEEEHWWEGLERATA